MYIYVYTHTYTVYIYSYVYSSLLTNIVSRVPHPTCFVATYVIAFTRTIIWRYVIFHLKQIANTCQHVWGGIVAS